MSKDPDALNDKQPRSKARSASTDIEISPAAKRANSADKQKALQAARNKNSNKQIERGEQIRKQVFGVVVGPKPDDGVQYASAHERFMATMKVPTKTDARALRVGDLIDVYYMDDLMPRTEIVIEPCEKDEDIYRVRTMPIEVWNAGGLRPSETRGPRYVNSECWVNLKRRATIPDHDPMLSVYEQRAIGQIKGKQKRIEFSLAANTRDGNHILIPLTKKQAALLQLCLPSQG